MCKSHVPPAYTAQCHGISTTDTLPSLRTTTFTDSNTGSFPINGTTLSQETYVHVRWGWIAFLVSQMALALAFFAASVLATARAGVDVRKSSLLPILPALNDELRDFSGPVVSVGGLKRNMKGVYGTFVGGRLVWHMQKDVVLGRDEIPAKRTGIQSRWWRKIRIRRKKQRVSTANSNVEATDRRRSTAISSTPRHLPNHRSEPPQPPSAPLAPLETTRQYHVSDPAQNEPAQMNRTSYPQPVYSGSPESSTTFTLFPSATLLPHEPDHLEQVHPRAPDSRGVSPSEL